MIVTCPPMDGVTAPWWEATRKRCFLLQRCGGCESVQHYPRSLCTSCGRTDRLQWTPAAGVATLDSYTVIHRATALDLPVPYVVARVRLVEGPLLLTNLIGEYVGDAAYGRQLELRWRPLTDGRHLPVFAVGAATLKNQEL